MSDYGKILMSTANAVGASLKKKMGSLTGFAPVDWAETINKLGNKLPERTVSGAVCSFADGADDVPMPLVKASITAVQAGSGDPSPSNVRAISGFAECDVVHAGVNIWDEETIAGYFDTSGNWSSSSTNLSSKNPIFVLPNTKYYIKCPAGISLYVTYWKSSVTSGKSHTTEFISRSGSSVGNTTITTPSNCHALHFNLVLGYDTTYNNDISVNYPSTDTSYHSYAGETIPVWMGGVNLWGGGVMLDSFKNAGISGLTYDSNTLTYTAPSVSQKVIPTIQYKENTQYTFILSMSNSLAYTDTNLYVYYTDGTRQQMKLPSASAGTKQTAVFTTVSGKTVDRVQGANSAGTITLYYNESGLFEGVKTAQDFEPCRYIYGGELNLTTGVLTVTHGYIASYDGETINEPWISSIDKYVAGNSPSTGAQVVYPLTTPTTIQLTAEEVRSFLGMNNLWANTGDSEVTYFAQPNVPTEVLYKGQISTTSSYATANFTESVEDDEEILVKVYCPARSAVDYKVIKVADIGNGMNVGFSLHTTVNCTITKTSIASYQYSGDYYDIYADVLAYDSAIFN